MSDGGIGADTLGRSFIWLDFLVPPVNHRAAEWIRKLAGTSAKYPHRLLSTQGNNERRNRTRESGSNSPCI